MAFKQLTPVSLADRVEEQLVESIHDGRFQPGAALPGEIELAEQMQVSRNVVREAVSRLRMLGLVESRKRKGSVVCRPDVFVALRRVLHPAVTGKDDARDLRDFRLMMEIGLADRLFKCMTDDDIDDLEVIVRKEEELECLSRDKRVELDVAFHRQLYLVTDNQMLIQFQELLIPFFEDVKDKHFERLHIELPPEATHRGLLEIIKHGTPSDFREAMRKHLMIFFEYMD